MKSYMMSDPMTIVVQDRSIDDIAEQEVLVKVTNIGLCGSDVHLFKGDYNGPRRYPILFGHEWSGVVAKIGASVDRFTIGDKVTSDCSRYCGTCQTCAIDRNLCPNIEKYGITVDGASAEYVVRNQKYLYKADPEVDLALLSLTEPIAVAKHLIEKIRKLTNEISEKRILIYGGGPIGQSVLLMLTDVFGCKNIDMMDLVASRLKLGVEFGANAVDLISFDSSEKQDYSSLYRNTVYDIVIETTGNPQAFSNSFKLLKPMGILGCLGMMQKAEIPQSQIVTKSLTIVGTIGGTGEFDSVIKYIQTHPEKAAKLISHRFPISETEKAFATASSGQNTMKINLFF